MSWPLVKLSDVCEINIGKTPARANSKYWGKGNPWLSIRDMNQGGNLYKTKEEITDLGVKESNIKIVSIGTVLFSFKLSIGKIGITQRPMYTNEAIAALPIKNKKILCEDYLVYALSKIEAGKTTDRAVMGATLNKKKLAELKIPLPPLDEQKRIAAILDKADAVRRKRQQAIGLTEQLLRSIFLDMFGDPVTNPKGFELRCLKDLYINEKEGTKCGPFGSALKKDEYKTSGVPVWNMNNISKTGNFVPPAKLWIDKIKFQQLETYNTINGDILISRAGTVGKMCVLNSNYEDSIISTNLIRLRFGKQLLPIYFVSLMNYCKGRVGRLKTGPDGAFTHMNTGVLDKLVFPYPPIELQKKYESIVEIINGKTKNQLTNLDMVEGLLKSTTQKAFRGELTKQTEAA